MQPVISFSGVGKRYQLGTMPSLRASLASLLSRVQGEREDIGGSGELWALRGVNLDVYPGETLGIIGPNGAGKSTVLKLIARITEPSTGKIAVSGRVSSLIELGAGFHPDLTGRENVYLNATILGLKRREIDRLFDEIIAFAELERFVDTPVKRYSSGMYARLGFAIAVHVNADILLVDEVLSVGDYSFQYKCFNAMEKLRQSAKSVVFISHNMPAVQSLCNRAILLGRGEMLAQGSPESVIQAYESEFVSLNSDSVAAQDIPEAVAPLAITGVSVLPLERSNEPDTLDFGTRTRVRIEYFARERVEGPLFHFLISRTDGTPCCGANAALDGFMPDSVEGTGVIEAVLPDLALPPSQYFVTAYVSNLAHTVDYARAVSRIFRVASQPYVDTRLGGYALRADWLNIESRQEPGRRIQG